MAKFTDARRTRAFASAAGAAVSVLAAQGCKPVDEPSESLSWRLYENTDRFTGSYTCGVLGNVERAGVARVMYFYYPPSEQFGEYYKIVWEFDPTRGAELDRAIGEAQDRCLQFEEDDVRRSLLCSSSFSERLELVAKIDGGAVVDTRDEGVTVVGSPSWQYDDLGKRRSFTAALDVTRAVSAGADSTTIDYRVFARVVAAGDARPEMKVDIFDDLQRFDDLQEGARMAQECASPIGEKDPQTLQPPTSDFDSHR